jgi:hypothetical protein
MKTAFSIAVNSRNICELLIGETTSSDGKKEIKRNWKIEIKLSMKSDFM